MSYSILHKLKEGFPNKRKEILNSFIRETLASFLELDSIEEIALDQNLIDLGTDSAQAVDFKFIIEDALDCSLRTTLLFDYPRLDTLTDYLIEDILKLDTSKTEQNLSNYKENGKLKDTKKEDIEKIAIVGMACRMPGGAMNPEDFWELQINNINAIEVVPKSRWDVDKYYSAERKPGTVSNKYGGFMKNIDSFDPQFFGISPKETIEVDPQQRMLMEVVWEAIENGGQSVQDLKGENIGVFIGIRSTEYTPPDGLRDPKNINLYSATGTELSAASGRISYMLGLTGPSVSMDTACSSSTVALHYACESIKSGDATGAIVGGVNILISGETNVSTSQGGMLSSDGMCKTFSEKADGYVRSEGCVALYLKPLSEAKKNNDPILGIIRATGVNQDGASGGLTVPHGPAQESLITKTLDKAKLKFGDISYVEAHGTGTPLGDPIEVGALTNTIGKGHTKTNPLIIGSVKTNIGHTEPAAGLAGLMKVVLSMNHEVIPANLHHNPPNPYIPWDDIPIVVAKKNTPWPRSSKPRYAGVNCFGFTGTNTHIILEEAPIQKLQIEPNIDRSHHLFVCSAKSKKALKELVKNYIKYFNKAEETSFANICYTSTVGRSHFQYRFSILASNQHEAVEALESFLEEKESTILKIGETTFDLPKVTFLFKDEKEVKPTIGEALYNTQPLFKEILNNCDEILKNRLDYPLPSSFLDQNSIEQSDDNKDAQMANFVFRYALAKCWISWGSTPHLLLGYGIGEYIAACIAEVFSLKDALKLVNAYINYQNGDLTERGFIIVAEEINYKLPVVNIVSEVTGTLVSKEITSSLYWINHLKIQNKNSNDIEKIIIQEECSIGLQIRTTNNSLRKKIDSCQTENKITWLGSLEAEKDFEYQVQENLQSLFILGVLVKWENFEKGRNYSKVKLPNYAFQRQKYWIEPGKQQTNPTNYSRARVRKGHQLLGTKINLANQENKTVYYESLLKFDAPHFLLDHCVYDHVVFPGAGYIEMALSAGISLKNNQNLKVSLSNISLLKALILPSDQFIKMQCSISHSQNDNNAYNFQINSISENIESDVDEPNEDSWQLRASGSIHLQNSEKETTQFYDIKDIKNRCDEIKSQKSHFQEMDNAGLHYGLSFQGIKQIWYNKEEALAEIHMPEVLKGEQEIYQFHPALLDACFQTLAVLLSSKEKEEALLPISMESIELYQNPKSKLWSYISEISREGAKHYHTDINILDEKGSAIMLIKGLKLVRTQIGQLNQNSQNLNKMLYSTSWNLQQERNAELSLTERNLQDSGNWLILSDRRGISKELATILKEQNESVVEVYQDEIDITNNENWEKLIEESFSTLKGVVNFWGMEQTIEQEVLHGSLCLLQTLDKKKWDNTPRFWWVTKGAQAVKENLELMNVNQSTIWGMRSSISLEMSAYKPTCIDLDSSEEKVSRSEIQQLFEEIWNPSLENQIAYRQNNRYVARLNKHRIENKQNNELDSAIDKNKYYLITGGLGSLGLKIAKSLVDNGAKHICLVGRSLPLEKAKQQIVFLEEKEANVQVFQADISQEKEVQKLFKDMDEKLPVSLGGLIHAAGVLDDGLLQQQNWKRFSKVLAPKVAGTWNLHQQTKDRHLDFFVCFSSMTSIIGTIGQSNYAAANAFMDALVYYRKGKGLPALSINWSAWAESGMASSMKTKDQERIRNMGLAEIAVSDGLKVFINLLKSNATQVGVAHIDWSKYFDAQRKEKKNKFLEVFSAPTQENNNEDFIKLLNDIPVEERERFLFEKVREEIAKVLGFASPDDIEARQPLFDLGVDSLLTIDLRNRLEATLCEELSTSLIFDYPTLEVLVQYLLNDVLNMGQIEVSNNELETDLLFKDILNLSEEELALELEKEIKASNLN